MNVRPVITGDQSHTLFVPELNEHYHSVFGAIAESKHIFIGLGLDHVINLGNSISILEVGFGTGLNVLLTYFETVNKVPYIHYTAVEPYPLERQVWETLNYPSLLPFEEASNVFQKIHEAEWESDHSLSKKFMLKKIKNKIQEAVLPASEYDLVYFDAFGPEVQPELWTEEVFRKIYPAMKDKSVLVTYSSKGVVRNAMKRAGFLVEKLPGPAGKREVARALKA